MPRCLSHVQLVNKMVVTPVTLGAILQVNAWRKRLHVRRYFWRLFLFLIQQSPLGVLGLDRGAYLHGRHVEQAILRVLGQRVRCHGC